MWNEFQISDKNALLFVFHHVDTSLHRKQGRELRQKPHQAAGFTLVQAVSGDMIYANDRVVAAGGEVPNGIA